MAQRAEEPWAPIAPRGELTLTILTAARAKLHGIRMHADAVLLGLLYPDELPAMRMGFASITSLQEFVAEMKPREIFIWTAGGEDARTFRAQLQRDLGGTLH